jgi:ribosomal protein S18 acetylase RimI-like enzyme
MIVRPYVETDHAAVRALFVRVNRELAPAHLNDAFEAYIERSLAEEVDRIAAYYGERDGAFWVAEENGAIVGMVGLEQVDATTVELRRMYVDPDARRRAVGRRLLQHAEDAARQGGYRTMVLSTSELQQAALTLYRNAGYRFAREGSATEQSNKTVGGGIRRFYFAKAL